jgi:hypothetical protein
VRDGSESGGSTSGGGNIGGTSGSSSGGSRSGSDDDDPDDVLKIDIGVFTEEQLAEMGIICGENVAQVVCDIYTKGNKISQMSIHADFADDEIGNSIAGFMCWAIQQGCIQDGGSYAGMFMYKGAPSGINWNRYAIDQQTDELNVLFLANWDVATFGGETCVHTPQIGE